MKGAVMSEEIQGWRDIIQQKGKRKRSQLTIQKSIADLLDEIPNEAKEYVRVNDFGEYSVLDDFVELREFYEADEDDIFPKFMELKDFVKDNLNLCVAYLTGKALGVDLVKVVEG
ncbi:hypothetical protein EFE21_09280 [Lactococcus lactis subsp. lactis]|nr:hypothetical protein [Lactococcus lactis subsp. lactis]